MFLYTHLALAHLLTTKIQVKELGDYFLGSVIPDIRYFLGRDRFWTHISLKEVDQISGPTDEASFETGYKVHLAIDKMCEERKTLRDLRASFPQFLARRLNRPLLNAIPDIYYMVHHRFQICSPTKFDFTLTNRLGIKPEQVKFIYRIYEDLFTNPTPKREVELLERSRLLSGRRAKMWKTIGLIGLRVPGVEGLIVARARETLAKFEEEVLNEVPTLMTLGESSS